MVREGKVRPLDLEGDSCFIVQKMTSLNFRYSVILLIVVVLSLGHFDDPN